MFSEGSIGTESSILFYLLLGTVFYAPHCLPILAASPHPDGDVTLETAMLGPLTVRC